MGEEMQLQHTCGYSSKPKVVFFSVIVLEPGIKEFVIVYHVHLLYVLLISSSIWLLINIYIGFLTLFWFERLAWVGAFMCFTVQDFDCSAYGSDTITCWSSSANQTCLKTSHISFLIVYLGDRNNTSVQLVICFQRLWQVVSLFCRIMSGALIWLIWVLKEDQFSALWGSNLFNLGS